MGQFSQRAPHRELASIKTLVARSGPEFQEKYARLEASYLSRMQLHTALNYLARQLAKQGITDLRRITDPQAIRDAMIRHLYTTHQSKDGHRQKPPYVSYIDKFFSIMWDIPLNPHAHGSDGRFLPRIITKDAN